MKKFLFILISFLLAAMLLVPSFGAEFNNIGLLYENWVTDGYPDYVTGIWSTYGDMSNLTVGILEGEQGQSGKEEILSLIENDSSVTFVIQKYPRNYLVGIMEELDWYIKRGLAFSCGGVYEMENVVKITLLNDKKDDEISESVKAEMIEKYGDAVFFDYGEAVMLYEELQPTIDIGPVKDKIESGNVLVLYSDIENTTQKSNKLFYIILIAALTLALGMPVFLIKRNKLLRASNGEIISEKALNDKEIENMIKEAEIRYPDELDAKIKNKIETK